MDCDVSMQEAGESVLSQPDTSVLSETDYVQSRAEKIELRRSYRKLIQDTQDNKEELVKADNNGLMENIAKAQELFQKVKEAREAALDSRFMSLAVSLGAQKTSLLQTDLIAFQPDEFIAKLITFMGGSAATDPDDIDIPNSCWDTLGKKTTSYYNSIVPALHSLSGVFERSEQTNSQAVKKQRMNKDVVEKAQLPQHLTNYKDGAKEATPAEIERVYNQIRRMCAQDAIPIDYFELVINPQSYGHTIENIFHLSFLVKDGLVSVSLNENGLPVVDLVNDIGSQSSSNRTQNSLPGHQTIVSLSYDEWEELVEAYDLKGKTPCIKPSAVS